MLPFAGLWDKQELSQILKVKGLTQLDGNPIFFLAPERFQVKKSLVSKTPPKKLRACGGTPSGPAKG